MEFNNIEGIFKEKQVLQSQAFLFEGREYKLKSIKNNCNFGKHKKLTCRVYRNDNERHNVSIYHSGNKIPYVNPTYSIN